MDAARWHRLSPLLDGLLDLCADQRRRRLAALELQDPALARELQDVLALELGHDDFLHDPLPGPRAGAAAGARLGPYRLERLLGEGGMGQVWLATRADGTSPHPLALKLLRAGYADPHLRERFSREREILGRLRHPNIAALVDAGIGSDDQPYLALEYVDGVPLGEYCARNALPVEARLRLFLQVCAAVSHAHANLVVHRDLKPSNMLVDRDGQVRLLDFGIATLIEGAADVRCEVRAFTLHYAAPEQIRGEPAGTLTDVYALGVVLYELLATDKPYRLRRESDAEWERSILDVVPVAASAAVQRLADTGRLAPRAARRLARQLRGDLDAILMRALQKPPRQRYASVEALALDLQRHLEGSPVHARPARPGYRLYCYLRRHRWGSALAGVGIVLLLSAACVSLWQAHAARDDATRARVMQRLVTGLLDPDAAGNRHARTAALLAATARGEAELADRPEARAELLGVAASLALAAGDHAQALSLATRQQALLDTRRDASDQALLDAATLHARLLRGADPPGRCLARLQPLQTVARRAEATEPRAVADFHLEAGRCLQALGEPMPARRRIEQALALRREHLGDAAGTAEALLALATLDNDTGQLLAAAQRLEQARQVLHRVDQPRQAVLSALQQQGDRLRVQQDARAAATRPAAAPP